MQFSRQYRDRLQTFIFILKGKKTQEERQRELSEGQQSKKEEGEEGVEIILLLNRLVSVESRKAGAIHLADFVIALAKTKKASSTIILFKNPNWNTFFPLGG